MSDPAWSVRSPTPMALGNGTWFPHLNNRGSGAGRPAWGLAPNLGVESEATTSKSSTDSGSTRNWNCEQNTARATGVGTWPPEARPPSPSAARPRGGTHSPRPPPRSAARSRPRAERGRGRGREGAGGMERRGGARDARGSPDRWTPGRKPGKALGLRRAEEGAAQGRREVAKGRRRASGQRRARGPGVGGAAAGAWRGSAPGATQGRHGMLGGEETRGTRAGLGRRSAATGDPGRPSRRAAGPGWLLRRGRGKGVGRRAGGQWEREPGRGGASAGWRPMLGKGDA